MSGKKLETPAGETGDTVKKAGQEESRICVDHVNRRLYHDVYPLELLDQSTS